MLVRMWLVVLPLVLAVGLVCGDAPSPRHGAHTSPSDAHMSSSNAYPSPSNAYMSPSNAYPSPSDAYPSPSDAYPSPSDAYPSPSDAYPSPSDAYPSPSDAYTPPSDAYVMPGRDMPCPAAEDIAPCVCMFRYDTLSLDCSNVASEDQLAQIFAGHFPSKNFDILTIKDNLNLKVLRSGVFGIITFQYIHIIYGELVEVQEGALSGSFTTAINIGISGQKLSSFPFFELEIFSQLQEFYIHGISIQDFPSLKSSTLSVIGFDYNPLTNLPATALRDLPNLRRCGFSATGISHIEPGTFTGLPHLKVIDLSNNNIQHIPTGAIQLDTTDSFVDLAQNNISSIAVGAVTGLKQGWLDLRYNRLKELDEAVFKPILDEEPKLLLYDNPLTCGCDIAWLITNQVYTARLGSWDTCHDGKKLTDLDPQIYENC